MSPPNISRPSDIPDWRNEVVHIRSQASYDNFNLGFGLHHDCFIKVRISWEGNKIFRNLHLILSYVVPVKCKVEISQNFVAFSEYMTFAINFLIK